MENINKIILEYLKLVEDNVLWLNSKILKFLNENIIEDGNPSVTDGNNEYSLISFFILGFSTFLIFFILLKLLGLIFNGISEEKYVYNNLDNGKVLDVIDNVIFL